MLLLLGIPTLLIWSGLNAWKGGSQNDCFVIIPLDQPQWWIQINSEIKTATTIGFQIFGYPLIRFELKVAVAKMPILCNLMSSGKVENEFSKYTWRFWFLGIFFTNHINDSSTPHFSVSPLYFPPYAKIIDKPSLTSSDHTSESPFMDFLEIALLGTATSFCFCWNYLLVYWRALLRFCFNAIVSH